MQSSSRSRLAVVTGAAALLLTTAALAAGGVWPQLWVATKPSGIPPPQGSPAPRVNRGPVDEPWWQKAEEPDLSLHGVLRRVWDATVWLAAAAGIALACWIVYRIVTRWMPKRRRTAAPSQAAPVPSVAEALDEATNALQTTVHADASIIAAWLQLEKLAARTGVVRRRSQTATEYVTDVLAARALNPDDLRALAALYTRAMFAPEPTTEDALASAIALLAGLRADIERTAAHA